MKVVGFTFVRNGVMFDYPFVESIKSLLPLCDEVVVAVGRSDDSTLECIKSLRSSKLRIIETIWDDSLRTHGTILSQQTNLALDHAAGDWAIYLQADEVLHEHDYPNILNAMTRYKDVFNVEGFLFHYNHFYGNYHYIGDSRRWYRREIRIVRPSNGVRSWGDAQGFRINGCKLHVKLIDAVVYHYGWVKPPAIQQLKQKYFNKLWHSDEWVNQQVGNTSEYDYQQSGKLKIFTGEHPSVMKDKVRRQNWNFLYHHEKVHQPYLEKMLDSFESRFGWRIGEYKNYIQV
jgi:glycosyltransferase involved in cell wall biosynthesis